MEKESFCEGDLFTQQGCAAAEEPSVTHAGKQNSSQNFTGGGPLSMSLAELPEDEFCNSMHCTDMTLGPVSDSVITFFQVPDSHVNINPVVRAEHGRVSIQCTSPEGKDMEELFYLEQPRAGGVCLPYKAKTSFSKDIYKRVSQSSSSDSLRLHRSACIRFWRHSDEAADFDRCEQFAESYMRSRQSRSFVLHRGFSSLTEGSGRRVGSPQLWRGGKIEDTLSPGLSLCRHSQIKKSALLSVERDRRAKSGSTRSGTECARERPHNVGEMSVSGRPSGSIQECFREVPVLQQSHKQAWAFSVSTTASESTASALQDELERIISHMNEKVRNVEEKVQKIEKTLADIVGRFNTHEVKMEELRDLLLVILPLLSSVGGVSPVTAQNAQDSS